MLDWFQLCGLPGLHRRRRRRSVEVSCSPTAEWRALAGNLRAARAEQSTGLATAFFMHAHDAAQSPVRRPDRRRRCEQRAAVGMAAMD